MKLFNYHVGNDVMCAVVNNNIINNLGQDICNGDSGSGIVYYQPNLNANGTPNG